MPGPFQSSVGTVDGQLAKFTPSGRFPHFLKVQFPGALAKKKWSFLILFIGDADSVSGMEPGNLFLRKSCPGSLGTLGTYHPLKFIDWKDLLRATQPPFPAHWSSPDSQRRRWLEGQLWAEGNVLSRGTPLACEGHPA